MPPPPPPGATAGPEAFPEPEVPVSLRSLEAGTPVIAFYHANHHSQGARFVHVCHDSDVRPLIGLSSGWLRATVLAPWRWNEADPNCVLVHFEGPFRDPLLGSGYAGENAGDEAVVGLQMAVHPGLVRPLGAPPPVPLLSVLILRWWDYRSNETWSDYSVTSDGLHRDLMDGRCGVFPTLAGEFEAYTAFVRYTADLDSISAHWAQAALQGINTVAWYFLWPQQLVSADKTGGSVREQKLFALCQRMERVGIRSGWPHPSSTYRQLCGKLWIPQMSLNPAYRVPPTTRVQYADVRADVERAAERAVEHLRLIRREVWGKQDVQAEHLRGVAKLGFSWQGDDVLPFQGVANLARVLVKLFEQRQSEQLTCLVQEMVPGVIGEHRVHCFRDAAAASSPGALPAYVRERLWLRMKNKGEHHNHQSACEVQDFAMASAHVISRDRAADEFFGGDGTARDQLEAMADRLVDRWLLWFSAECADPPPATRLDFLVAAHDGEGGGPTVWTCEVGEMGASLCSVECDARNRAAINWAVRKDPSGRFPLPLPAITRNNGWKS